MDAIRNFFGGIITKLKLGWLVEQFSVNGLATRVGSLIVIVLIIGVIVKCVKMGKSKKLQKKTVLITYG